VLRPYRDEAFLRQKYLVERLSTTQIADLIFSSRSTVSAALKRYRIPIRSEAEARVHRKGQLRYGEKCRQGKVESLKRELETVEKMKELRDQGYSYREIADILNTMKVPTKTRRAKWRATTIMKILKRGQALCELYA